MITFGEVLQFKGSEYVYLAATEEIIYLARILNSSEGDTINSLYLKKLSGGAMSKVRVADSPLYCFVILTTEEFKNRMAHLHKSGYDFGPFSPMECMGRLNEKDLKEIKETIISGPVPLELKDLVKGIKL